MLATFDGLVARDFDNWHRMIASEKIPERQRKYF
jgi:hypothetical protein